MSAKFVQESHFSYPDAAALSLAETAKGCSNLYRSDKAFLEEGGTPDRFCAALARAISQGWPLAA